MGGKSLFCNLILLVINPIFNIQIMEKLKAAIQPEKFSSIKVIESTGALKFMKFDAEITNKKKLSYVISRIDKKVSDNF